MLLLKTFLIILFSISVFISSVYPYAPQYVDADEKIKLRWQRKKIPISVSKSLFEKSLNIKNGSDVLDSIKKSLKHWEDVANIEFQVSFTDQENVSEISSSGDNISLITIAQTSDNLLLFDEKLNETSAITRLFYNSKGEIKEADIVLNPILLFSTDGTFGSFDLEATLTHEIGHFLGLGHSKIFGATMHNHQGINGIYNLPGYNSRTLSEDDKAGAISLYGSNTDDEFCCGSVNGQLTNAKSKSVGKFHVWVEEIGSGRVIAGVVTDSVGNYKIEGISKSRYNIYAQDINGEFVTTSLGEIDLTKTHTVIVNRDIITKLNEFDVYYLGMNGQLSSLAIPISSGKSQTIYIGGQNLNDKTIQIEFHSKNFKVIKNSLMNYDYGDELSVISFDVLIDENTPNGEYSFYLKNSNGSLKHLVGCLSIDTTTNS